jgi:hypothetical protein
MALPFLITPLVAYALYHYLVKLPSQMTKVHESIFLGVIVVLLVGLAWTQYPDVAQIKNSQHLTPEKYAALLWIQQNTPKDAQLYFLDGYYQMSEAYDKRISYDLDIPDFIQVLQAFASSNGTVLPTQYNRTGSIGNTEMGNNAIDTGSFFTYDHVTKKSSVQNITNFDYVVMADFQIGDQPYVQAFNARMITQLVSEEGWRLVYEQNGIHIVQNPRGGSGAA